MTSILDLSDKEFKVTMINVLRNLTEEVDSRQEQMANVSSVAGNSKEKIMKGEMLNSTLVEQKSLLCEK
jgi:hypothetical protein